MSDRPYWCEICARKKECYGITLKPKCFVPTADRKTEPQKDCKKCKNYEKCKNNKWKCCVYQPIEDEPQTEEPSFTATDFGKGTITRYTDEPQTDCCETCKHKNDGCYSEACGPCSSVNSNYEPMTDCHWK